MNNGGRAGLVGLGLGFKEGVVVGPVLRTGKERAKDAVPGGLYQCGVWLRHTNDAASGWQQIRKTFYSQVTLGKEPVGGKPPLLFLRGSRQLIVVAGEVAAAVVLDGPEVSFASKVSCQEGRASGIL